MTEPNSARPTISPTALVMVKVRLRNRLKARIGSRERASTATKPKSETIAAAPRPSTKAELQGKVLPPRLVTRMMEVSASESSAAPG